MTHEDCMRLHIRPLIALLDERGIRIYSEHGEEPSGWVNVSCERCKCTHEISLHPDDQEET